MILEQSYDLSKFGEASMQSIMKYSTMVMVK